EPDAEVGVNTEAGLIGLEDPIVIVAVVKASNIVTCNPIFIDAAVVDVEAVQDRDIVTDVHASLDVDGSDRVIRVVVDSIVLSGAGELTRKGDVERTKGKTGIDIDTEDGCVVVVLTEVVLLVRVVGPTCGGDADINLSVERLQ